MKKIIINREYLSRILEVIETELKPYFDEVGYNKDNISVIIEIGEDK